MKLNVAPKCHGPDAAEVTSLLGKGPHLLCWKQAVQRTSSVHPFSAKKFIFISPLWAQFKRKREVSKRQLLDQGHRKFCLSSENPSAAEEMHSEADAWAAAQSTY